MFNFHKQIPNTKTHEPNLTNSFGSFMFFCFDSILPVDQEVAQTMEGKASTTAERLWTQICKVGPCLFLVSRDVHPTNTGGGEMI